MSIEVTEKLSRFESLISSGKIESFSVSLLHGGLLIRSLKGEEEQYAHLDQDTLSSLNIFFHGKTAIEYGSFDYISLKSLINAKTIIERMRQHYSFGKE